MRNISFQLTTEQILNRTKTVTRRLGWKNVKVGEVLQACEKCQGLGRGGKINKLCQIRVKSTSRETLATISELGLHSECRREGFPNMEPEEFIAMFCKHMNCTPYTEVTRIEFEYL